MNDKGIWDLIAKLATPIFSGNGQNSTEENRVEEQSEKEKTKTEGQINSTSNPFSASFAKSYNPFAGALQEKGQISSPKTQKPLKKTIDLNNSKPIKSKGENDKTKNVIDLITRHNRHSQKIIKNRK